MGKVQRFEDLEVWKKSRKLSKLIFELYQTEPFNKDFKLNSQINAASGSIMDNIAEGFERSSTKEFIQFLAYSKGSAGEVRSQIYRAKDRNYINEQQFELIINELIEISKMLSALSNYLKQSEYKGSRFNE